MNLIIWHCGVHDPAIQWLAAAAYRKMNLFLTRCPASQQPMKSLSLYILLPAIVAFVASRSDRAMDLVRDGKPVTTIVTSVPREAVGPASAKGRLPKQRLVPETDEAIAVRTRVESVKNVTDAELPVADRAPDGAPPSYVGQATARGVAAVTRREGPLATVTKEPPPPILARRAGVRGGRLRKSDGGCHGGAGLDWLEGLCPCGHERRPSWTIGRRSAVTVGWVERSAAHPDSASRRAWGSRRSTHPDERRV